MTKIWDANKKHTEQIKQKMNVHVTYWIMAAQIFV